MYKNFAALIFFCFFFGCAVFSHKPIQEEAGTLLFYGNDAYFSFPAGKIKEIKVITVVTGTQREYQISKIEGGGPLFRLEDTTQYSGSVVLTKAWNDRGFDNFVLTTKPKSKHAIVRIATFNKPEAIYVSGIGWSYAYRAGK